jgi:hypothetical protein
MVFYVSPKTKHMELRTAYTAIGFFSIAALAGIYLLTLVLKNKEIPLTIALMHGALAVAGLAILIYYVTQHSPGPVESLILFVMAALGGLVMIYRDITGRKVPKWLAVVHGILAAGGLLVLLGYTLSQ